MCSLTTARPLGEVLDGVQLNRKKTIEDLGGTPHSIGSVVAVYQINRMLVNIIKNVFGREIQDTRIYLFDNRPTTPANEQLLAMYDPMQTAEQMQATVIDKQHTTVEDLKKNDDVQVNTFDVSGVEVSFVVALVPTDDYIAAHTTNAPYIILCISIALVIFAQLERWMGHPWVMSQDSLVRTYMEREIRVQVEAEANKRLVKMNSKSQSVRDCW